MNKVMTDNWNSVVKDSDVVFHMGDFSMKQPGKYAEKLQGEKILILGNHDKLSQCKGHFDEIHESLYLNIGGHKVLLNHLYYKEMLDNSFDHKFKDLMPSYKKDQILLAGHAHNSMAHINKKYKAINLAVEHLNYTPMSETRLLEIINEF